jgi:hypothetical protein
MLMEECARDALTNYLDQDRVKSKTFLTVANMTSNNNKKNQKHFLFLNVKRTMS